MKVFFLLPAYNEEKTILPLLKRIKEGMCSRGFEYEVIVYNDGSTDNTLEILQNNENNIPLRIIGKSKNEGLGFAVRSLLSEVVKTSANNEDIAIIHDSDNTHNPEHVYHMVNKIKDGFDVVIASRYMDDSRTVGVSPLRQFLSLMASWLMRLVFPIKGIRDYTCGYRAYSIPILKKAFTRYGDGLIEQSGFACMAELLIKLRALPIIAVETPIILRYDRKEGESKMDILQTVKKTLLMLFRLKFNKNLKDRQTRLGAIDGS